MRRLPSVLIIAIASITSIDRPVFAQPNLPACQAPSTGEYLLLVVSPSVDSQKQLRNALPSELKTTTCKYINETVTRIGGFKTVDDANRWARYINNIVGLSAIISTRPTKSAVASAPSTTVTQPTTVPTKTTTTTTSRPATTTAIQPATTPTRTTTAPSQKVTYNPRVLGEGYAVLVDYFNRPELANSVQKAVGGDVGLVSYGQRPYLLAVYTTNQREAYNTLQKLSENGFLAVLADGRKVVLLRSVIPQ
jgi:cell division septation protein DedD